MKQIVPMIPVEAINQMMKELVPENDSNIVIVNFNNEAEGNVYPTEAQFLEALKAARAENITAYVDNVKNEPIMTTMPKAGSIKKEVKNDKLGYTQLTLSNGATVILKHTDFKKDQVALAGRGIGGNSLYGKADFANLQMFDDVIDASHSAIYLQTLPVALHRRTLRQCCSLYTYTSPTSTRTRSRWIIL